MKKQSLLLLALLTACSAVDPTGRIPGTEATVDAAAGAPAAAAPAPSSAEDSHPAPPAPEWRSDATGAAAAPPPVLHVLFLGGQSNVIAQLGTVTPSGLPDATIPMLARSLGPPGFEFDTGSEPVALDAVSGFHSAEVSAARAMRARGWSVAVVKLARGSSWLGEWLPEAPTGYWAELVTQHDRAETAWGNRIAWHFVWLQSESDSQQPSRAAEYEGNLRRFSGLVHDLFGADFTQCKLQPSLAPASTGPVIRAAQVKVMAEQNWSHLLDFDDINGALHYTSPELDVLGSRMAASFQ